MELMFLLAIIELSVCFVFTIWLYYYYIRKGVSVVVSIVTITSWCLTFGIIVLLPFDILITKKVNDNQNITQFLRVSYFVIYWTIFLLSWLVIPFWKDYESAGDFTFTARVKRSIRLNLLFYAFAIGLSIIIILYLWFTGQWKFSNILQFCIDASNMFGLWLIIFLLGFGWVCAPKNMYLHLDYQRRIQFLEWKMGGLEEKLIDMHNDYIVNGYIIQSTFKQCSSETNAWKDYVMIIKEMADEYRVNSSDFKIKLNSSRMDELPASNWEALIELNQKTKENYFNILRLGVQKMEIYDEWILLKSWVKQDTEAYSTLKQRDVTPIEWTQIKNYYYKYVRPVGMWCLFFTWIILGVITFLSEVTIFFSVIPSVYGIIINYTQHIVLLHLLTWIPFVFLFYNIFYSLFSLKVSGLLRMYPKKQTDSCSILFVCSFMCKIGFPLALNFIQMIKWVDPTLIEENFGVFASKMAFNREFNAILPMVLILLITLNYFNVFAKVQNFLGFNTFGINCEAQEELIQNGREYLMKMNKQNNMISECPQSEVGGTTRMDI